MQFLIQLGSTQMALPGCLCVPIRTGVTQHPKRPLCCPPSLAAGAVLADMCRACEDVVLQPRGPRAGVQQPAATTRSAVSATAAGATQGTTASGASQKMVDEPEYYVEARALLQAVQAVLGPYGLQVQPPRMELPDPPPPHTGDAQLGELAAFIR